MRKETFSLSAYRHLRLLKILSQAPASLDEIQHAFKVDPNINKILSQDTVGLYMNTLRALGCEIDRPKPSTQFCYQLKQHAFSYHLTPTQMVTLNALRKNIDGLIALWDFYYWMCWIEALIENSNNSDKPGLRAIAFEGIENIYWHALHTKLDALEAAITEKQLLKVTYTPTGEKAKSFVILPSALFYKNSLLYVSGHSLMYDDAQILRLDKLDNIEPIEDEETLRTLTQNASQTYLVRIQQCQAHHYPWFSDNDDVTQDPYNPNDLLIKVSTDNAFLLKQHLLSLGYPFQVLFPQSFKQNILGDLETLTQHYNQPSSYNNEVKA